MERPVTCLNNFLRKRRADTLLYAGSRSINADAANMNASSSSLFEMPLKLFLSASSTIASISTVSCPSRLAHKIDLRIRRTSSGATLPLRLVIENELVIFCVFARSCSPKPTSTCSTTELFSFSMASFLISNLFI